MFKNCEPSSAGLSASQAGVVWFRGKVRRLLYYHLSSAATWTVLCLLTLNLIKVTFEFPSCFVLTDCSTSEVNNLRLYEESLLFSKKSVMTSGLKHVHN